MVKRRRVTRPERAQEPPRGEATPDATRERLAGYRVVRKLGVSSAATVYLGHPGGAGDTLPTVALKVFGDDVPTERIDAEIDALTGVDSPHIVRLLDVAMAPARPRCLVLERLTGGSVTALLHGADLSPGAAVTILVAAVRGLESLHTAGFGHDRLTQSSLLLDATGRPVLVSLGHATRLPGGTLARWRARRADHGRLALLCHTVFDAVAVPDASLRGHAIAEWLQALPDDTPRAAPDLARELERDLFDLADPLPLLKYDAPGAAAMRQSVGSRLALPSRQEQAAPPLPPAPEPARPRQRPPASVVSRLWALTARLVDGDVLPGLRAAVAHRLHARRRPLLVAGLVGGALLLVTLALVPPSGRTDATPLPTHPAVKQHREASATPSPTVGGGAEGAAITADDPVAAVTALLTRRENCLRTASLSCLDEVDQLASPLLDLDQSFVGRRANDPSEPSTETYAGFGVSLIQRSGGSALVALTPPRPEAGGSAETPKPASALVIEGEAGWRLREVFAD